MRHSISNRRHNAGFIFLNVPWWLNVALAALCYGGIVFALPEIGKTSPIVASLAHGFYPLATYLAGFFLILADLRFILDLRQKRQRAAAPAPAPSGTAAPLLDSISWQEMLQLATDGFLQKGFAVEYPHYESGADLILKTRDGERWVAVCRHWQNQVIDAHFVRELLGIMSAEEAHVGVFLTAGGFTQSAAEFAHGKRIFLLGGPEFLELIGIAKAQQATA